MRCKVAHFIYSKYVRSAECMQRDVILRSHIRHLRLEIIVTLGTSWICHVGVKMNLFRANGTCGSVWPYIIRRTTPDSRHGIYFSMFVSSQCCVDVNEAGHEKT